MTLFHLRSRQIAPDFDLNICGQIVLNGKNYPYYNAQTMTATASQALTIAVKYRRIEVKLRRTRQLGQTVLNQQADYGDRFRQEANILLRTAKLLNFHHKIFAD